MRQHIADRRALAQIQRVAGFTREVFQHAEKENAYAHRNYFVRLTV